MRNHKIQSREKRKTKSKKIRRKSEKWWGRNFAEGRKEIAFMWVEENFHVIRHVIKTKKKYHIINHLLACLRVF